MQHLADKAKLLRKEARGMQHMVMKDEVRSKKLHKLMDCVLLHNGVLSRNAIV